MAVATPAEGRYVWADVARGVCVVLVVAMHVYGLLFEEYFADAPTSGAWDALVSAAQPLRMPLFFLISGFLAAGALLRPWRTVARRRIALIAYLYFVWLVVYVIVAMLRAAIAETPMPVAQYAWQFLWPGSSLWYLYALVLYFVIAKATARIPLPALLLVGVVLSVCATSFLPDGTLQYVMRCFVFFLVGCRLPEAVPWIVSHARWGRLALAVVLYGAACLAAIRIGMDTVGIIFLAGILGIVAALWASKLLEHSAVVRPFVHIGRNTLAIFVMHPALVALISLGFTVSPAAAQFIADRTVLVAAFPAVVTVALIVVTLALEKAMRRSGLRLMFELPAPRKDERETVGSTR